MGSSLAPCATHLRMSSAPEWIRLERFQGRSPASLPDTTQIKEVASLKSAERTRIVAACFVRGLTQSDSTE